MLTAPLHKILLACTLVGFCGVISAQPLANTKELSGTAATDALVLKAAQASFTEYFELLALPNDAVVPADIQKNTDWLEQQNSDRSCLLPPNYLVLSVTLQFTTANPAAISYLTITGDEKMIISHYVSSYSLSRSTLRH